MNPKRPRTKRHLRRTVRKHGEAAEVVASHLYSVHAKVKWAKKNGFLERRPKGGRASYRLSTIGRYEFYYQFGHEKPWRLMTPAQQNRAARMIIEGALAKYGSYNAIKSVVHTVHHPLNRTLAGLILTDISRLQQQLYNMKTLFRAQHMDQGLSLIASDQIRRMQNTLGIFQAVFRGLQSGKYTLER